MLQRNTGATKQKLHGTALAEGAGRAVLISHAGGTERVAHPMGSSRVAVGAGPYSGPGFSLGARSHSPGGGSALRKKQRTRKKTQKRWLWLGTTLL